MMLLVLIISILSISPLPGTTSTPTTTTPSGQTDNYNVTKTTPVIKDNGNTSSIQESSVVSISLEHVEAGNNPDANGGGEVYNETTTTTTTTTSRTISYSTSSSSANSENSNNTNISENVANVTPSSTRSSSQGHESTVQTSTKSNIESVTNITVTSSSNTNFSGVTYSSTQAPDTTTVTNSATSSISDVDSTSKAADATSVTVSANNNFSDVESSTQAAISSSTNDASTPTDEQIMFGEIRLPYVVKPTFYEITMKPYIYEITEEPFKYDCKTVINITCYEDTYVIKLHLRLHEIVNIQLYDVTADVEVPVDHFAMDDATEMVGVLLHDMLVEGKEYTLEIDTIGVITDTLQGFYRSPYKVGNETRYISTTMMEPTDARKVFPCFDEPDFKAVFLFYIYRKEGTVCLTNLPLRETIGPDEDGFYLDIFDQPRNVPMSTYLVAIALGDLAYIETYLGDVRFRAYTRAGAENLAHFGLEIAVKTTEFFEKYFEIPYSLPKQDIIAVPTMSFNAMEHWGLITGRESSLLTEEGVSSTVDKEWTAVLMAHEISHMWFGNIVSPKWWDELWLNEGFATYMMMLAVDKVIPEWEMMTKMPVDYRGTQNVFGVDDSLTSHPVYVPVENPSEIGEIFDLISYAKGSAVIRMMHFILGDETFRVGLKRFLTDYGFDTATHDDLWNSLSQQAIEDGNPMTDVKYIMDTWIKEMNYPVVTVAKLGENVCLKQNAFLLTAEERQNRSHVFWNIPFTYSTNINSSHDKLPEDIVWMKNDGNIVCFVDYSMADANWILGNVKQVGYFRVNYDEENWRAILRQLSENHEVFHPINRAQIINDAWHLAAAGLLDFEIALSTFDYLDKEVHFVPWKAAYRNIDFIRRALQLSPLYGDYQKYLKKKIEKAYLYSANPQTHNEKMRYMLLGYEACQYGLKACVDDAMVRFNEWVVDENVRIDPDMKGTVYCTGVKNGGSEAWEFVLQKYLNSDSPTERRFLVDALACAEEPWLLAKLSNTALFSTVNYFSTTDKITVMAEMGTTPIGRMMAWNFIEQHWDVLFERYGTELNLLPTLLKAVTRSFNQPFELRRLERLAEEKQNNPGTGPRLFTSVLTKVKSNIRWIDAHYGQLERWIKQRI